MSENSLKSRFGNILWQQATYRKRVLEKDGCRLGKMCVVFLAVRHCLEAPLEPRGLRGTVGGWE